MRKRMCPWDNRGVEEQARASYINYGTGILMVVLAGLIGHFGGGFWWWMGGGTIVGATLALRGHFPHILTLPRIGIGLAVLVVASLLVGIGWYVGLKQPRVAKDQSAPTPTKTVGVPPDDSNRAGSGDESSQKTEKGKPPAAQTKARAVPPSLPSRRAGDHPAEPTASAVPPVVIKDYQGAPCSNGPIVGDSNSQSVVCGAAPLVLSDSSRKFIRDKLAKYAGKSVTLYAVGTATQSTRTFLINISEELARAGVVSKFDSSVGTMMRPVSCPSTPVLFMLPNNRMDEADLLAAVLLQSGVTKDEIGDCPRSGEVDLELYVFNR
jgi:hypothetical protein